MRVDCKCSCARRCSHQHIPFPCRTGHYLSAAVPRRSLSHRHLPLTHSPALPNLSDQAFHSVTFTTPRCLPACAWSSSCRPRRRPASHRSRSIPRRSSATTAASAGAPSPSASISSVTSSWCTRYTVRTSAACARSGSARSRTCRCT